MDGSPGRALVTGGAGFVGSHLCDRLHADGWSVIALDDLSTGARDNVAHLAASPRFRLVEADAREPYDLEVDRVYNLACPASPVHYQHDPVRTTLVAVLGTLRALELAARRGARFLQASTSEVYGEPLEHPQRETYRGNVSPTGPRACYDEGKRCAESLCADFARTRGADVRIARIFNTYGPRMALDDGRVVSNFLVQALRGEALTVYGDGAQTRSLCYVDDLVDGLVRLMEHPTERGPVNLGNTNESTMLELVEATRLAVGRDVRVVHLPLPVDDPTRRCPDTTLARERLGFSPKVALRDGLARTAEDFRARLGRRA
jgi:UDP-glucuronate decarboxylase